MSDAKTPQVSKEKESGTTAPAEAPVKSPVKEKYKNVTQEPVKNKESRVILANYKHPAATGKYAERGGLPRNQPGSDGLPLLTQVAGGALLHRLAAKRFEAMNAKWLADNPGEEPLKVSSGWRTAAFANYDAYHRWCRDSPAASLKPYWLDASHPPGVATLTSTYPDPARYPNKRPEQVINGFGRKTRNGKLVRDMKNSCTGAKAYKSPHETGLAMDLSHPNFLEDKKSTNQRQKESKAHVWITNNAHLFGITPFLTEAWHWEVQMPLESWITGEDWVEGDNYAVRVKGTGRTGKVSDAASALAAGAARGLPCRDRGLVGKGSKNPQGTIDLTQYSVLAPELPGVKEGTEFPDSLTSPSRPLEQITRIIIHETGGGFGNAPSNIKGGEPKALRTLIADGHSTHFTITRGGTVRQHTKLTRVARHGPENRTSIGVDLVNFPILKSEKIKKNWVNRSTDSEAYPVLDKGFMRPGHLLNTPAQCEAMFQLIRKCMTKAPNIPMVFPCADKGGSFTEARDPRHGNPGIIAHQRHNHADGVFVEYYCMCRSKGIPKMKAWYASVGAAAKRGMKEPIPLPGQNVEALATLGTEKLKETREKYYEEKVVQNEG